MRAAGVDTLVDARDVSIIGVPEIARSIGKLYRAYRTLLSTARSRRPAAVVLIDWPDFNMRLAKKLHRQGFKIVYYISPQVWAWRKYRIRAMRRDIDRMLVILPFEEQFFQTAGVDVEYVGHPLATAVSATLSREDFCKTHGLDGSRPLFALLPGSRGKEIHYHLPLMLDAAARLNASGLKNSTLGASQGEPVMGPPQFVLPLASTIRREQVEESIRAHLAQGSEKGNTELTLTVIARDTYNVLCHSDFAIVASGTATVEAALAGTPMVIIYRGSELNWRLIRPLIHLDTFGMVNLIAGSRIVPELMQHQATAENIAREVTGILSDPARVSRMRQDLKRVRESLSAGGNSGAARAAQAVIEVISGPPNRRGRNSDLGNRRGQAIINS